MRVSSVSTGIRFTTLPDATPPSSQISDSTSSTHIREPSQPPTTITALFNPMLGHITGAYVARVSRDLSLASRFDFNVYSYQSEWTVGAEWWTRRNKPKQDSAHPLDSVSLLPSTVQHRPPEPSNDVQGVVKARLSTTTVSSDPHSLATFSLNMITHRTSQYYGKDVYKMF